MAVASLAEVLPGSSSIRTMTLCWMVAQQTHPDHPLRSIADYNRLSSCRSDRISCVVRTRKRDDWQPLYRREGVPAANRMRRSDWPRPTSSRRSAGNPDRPIRRGCEISRRRNCDCTTGSAPSTKPFCVGS